MSSAKTIYVIRAFEMTDDGEIIRRYDTHSEDKVTAWQNVKSLRDYGVRINTTVVYEIKSFRQKAPWKEVYREVHTAAGWVPATGGKCVGPATLSHGPAWEVKFAG